MSFAKALMTADAKWIRLSKELNDLTKNDRDAQAYAFNLFNLFLKADGYNEDQMAEKFESIVEDYVKSLPPKLLKLDPATKSDVARKLVYGIRDKTLELAKRSRWIVDVFGDALSEKLTGYFKTQVETMFSTENIDKMINKKLSEQPLPVHLRLLERAGFSMQRPVRESELKRWLKNNGDEVTKLE